MRVAIVGTRNPTEAQVAEVFRIVARTPPDAVIVSGASYAGIDVWARRAAHFYRRTLVEYPPRSWSREDCLERNRTIAQNSDCGFAMPGPEYPHKGGTGYTVRQLRKLNKYVRVTFGDGRSVVFAPQVK